MALENLSPIVREERLLAGEDLEPVTRLEYFLKQAGSGGSGSVEYEPVLAETTKSVNDQGWITQPFSGGPIFEGTSYRVTVNGVTYEPLIGTAGEVGYICLGNTYVDDADPTGHYPFGIFYKNDTLTAWLETGESITMQIDQIIQLVPVPSPAAADTGKVLMANNGAAEWSPLSNGCLVLQYDSETGYLDKTALEIAQFAQSGIVYLPVYSSEAGVQSYVYYTLSTYVNDSGYTFDFRDPLDGGNNLSFWADNGTDYPGLD